MNSLKFISTRNVPKFFVGVSQITCFYRIKITILILKRFEVEGRIRYR